MDTVDPSALALRRPPSYSSSSYGVTLEPSPSPTPSSSSMAMTVAPAAPSTNPSSSSNPNLPPKPDRTKHDVVKARYRVLQSKWHDLVADRNKLIADLEAAEQKREKLQAEADMLIEQMHELAPDVSLAPDFVDLSSDDEGSPPYDIGGSYGHSYGHLDQLRHDGSSGQDLSIDNSMLPSSSINYFSSSLFGPNSGFDINMHSPPPLPSAPLASTSSSYMHNTANGRASMTYGISSSSNGKDSNNSRAPPSLPKQERLIMLTPEQAHEEELRIEEEQKARQKTKSYNPDNVKVRIGVMPSTFVHPLVHGGGMSNRSSKSRSPSSVSDNALEGIVTNGDSGVTATDSGHALGQRPAKRARTISKEKSPIKETDTIKEEEEPNPP